MISSSSMVSTTICGVISSRAFLSSSSFEKSAGVTFCRSRWRSVATWRASSSVLVTISPFTFTSTCSRISAESGSPASRTTTSAATAFFMMALSCGGRSPGPRDGDCADPELTGYPVPGRGLKTDGEVKWK